MGATGGIGGTYGAMPELYVELYRCVKAGELAKALDIQNDCCRIIYNIPQLAGVSLTSSLLKTMLENPRVIGVKNSSMPIQDIEMWRDEGAIVFNGPDEQLLSGLVAGAVGGIGGTYAAMPELYIKIFDLVKENRIAEAREIQDTCCHIIYAMCSGKGNMYGMIKEIIRKMNGPDLGGVRAPLFDLVEEDLAIATKCVEMIREANAKYLA